MVTSPCGGADAEPSSMEVNQKRKQFTWAFGSVDSHPQVGESVEHDVPRCHVGNRRSRARDAGNGWRPFHSSILVNPDEPFDFFDEDPMFVASLAELLVQGLAVVYCSHRCFCRVVRQTIFFLSLFFDQILWWGWIALIDERRTTGRAASYRQNLGSALYGWLRKAE